MRPPGEIRAALFDSALQLAAAGQAPCTWRDIAVHAQVGFDSARLTVKNMVRDGLLEPTGYRREPNANRPMRTLRPVRVDDLLSRAQQAPPHMQLAGVMSSWQRFD
jgi:hypothetical protein